MNPPLAESSFARAASTGEVSGVRVLRGLAELPSVREAWRALATHPWSDPDYYHQHVAHEAAFVSPHVLVVEREGAVVGLVAGQVRHETLPWRVGSLAIGTSRARVLWVAAGGVMGETGGAAAEAVTMELIGALARGEADAAYLHQIEPDGPLARALAQAPVLARDHGARSSFGWLLELPESYAAYHASRSKSVRRHLKRYAQALERELGDGLEIVCHREPAALERLVQDSEAVARLTYHRGMGVGFADTPELRRFFAHALAAGWMRGHVLYAHGKPIAFWHGLVYRGTLFTRDTGFDPAYTALRPGQYLLNQVIEEACRTHEVARIDYGVMELDYKRNFGSHRYERRSFYLFSRRPKGLYLSTLRSATAVADRTARRVLGSHARGLARRLANLGRRTEPQPSSESGGHEREPSAAAGERPDCAESTVPGTFLSTATVASGSA
jgi:CelD/BcsL family acetyltransferase involved in cellulose biosynthesis